MIAAHRFDNGLRYRSEDHPSNIAFTPNYVLAPVRAALGGWIDLDPCTTPDNPTRAEFFYAPPEDGAALPWNVDSIYVNPPYGADRRRGTTIKDWLRKCAAAHEDHGSEVLALVPVATNTKHWKLYVFGAAAAVAFLYDTRLRFLVDGKDEGKGAPMSCAMVYWGKHVARFDEVFTPFGAVLDLRDLQGKPVGVAREERTTLLFPTDKLSTHAQPKRRAHR